ncbi:hypothetical protein [Silvimonas iriomotensis]|uniref:Uncharacterized protein n=1 Tax=Silvimonas iriomotensis TaxID=449662 RepID=A0ABQ2P6C6_9NEIS|nr:hypothetical protein [Silvimonas iriomotensis]GGP18935.1 hypothetical protein GCM10010970_08120 [Silvimonas iriomotensis]
MNHFLKYPLFALIAENHGITLHDTETEADAVARTRIAAGASRVKIRDLSAQAGYAYKYWDATSKDWIKIELS